MIDIIRQLLWQGCSQPSIPSALSPSAAQNVGFKGLVFHSQAFKANLEALLKSVPAGAGTVALVGGGKSAQE